MPLALLTIPDWLPWLLMAGGGAVVVAVIVWLAFSRRQPPTTDTPAARFAKAKQRAAEHVTAPMRASNSAPGQSARDAMMEVKEIADAVATELDEKAARLERLLKAADERIEDLQRQLARQPASTFAGPRDQAASVSRAASAARGQQDDEHSDPDPMTARVIALAEQGLNPVQIAQRTGQGIGTVELILALRR